jgi:hypothetical protein
MKFTFNKKFLLALIYIFLICNSSILAVKYDIALTKLMKKYSSLHTSRRHHTQGHSHSSHKVARTVFDMKACPQPTLDIISFLIGIKTGFSMTIVKHIASVIIDETEIHEGTQKCMKIFKDAYDAKIHEAEQEIENYVKEGLNRDLEILENIGLTPSEKDEAERLRNNPKDLCNYLREKISEKISEQKTEREKLQKMLNYLNDQNHIDWELPQFEEFAKPSVFSEYPTRNRLYEFLKSIKRANPGVPFYKIIDIAILKIEVKRKMIKISKKNLREINNFNCGDLPNETDAKRDCYQVGIATKAKTFWNLLKSLNKKRNIKLVDECLVTIIGEQLLSTVVTMAVDMILSMIVNIIGFMALSIIKVVYFGVLFIKRLYSSIVETDVSLRSRYIGEAIGYAINIVKSALQMKKKKKFRKMK